MPAPPLPPARSVQLPTAGEDEATQLMAEPFRPRMPPIPPAPPKRRPIGTAPPSATLLPAHALGHFAVGDVIASGDASVVLRAEHRQLGHRVAVKVLRPERRGDAAAAARLVASALATSRIAHPNVVTVYDHGASPDGTFVVMELLAGETLAARLARLGRLPRPLALELGCQLTSALAAAHAAGVCHGALTADHVFLATDPVDPNRALVKLIGLAGDGNGPDDAAADLRALGGLLQRLAPGPAAGVRAPHELEPDLGAELARPIAALLGATAAAAPRLRDIEHELAGLGARRGLATLPASPSGAELQLLAHQLLARHRTSLSPAALSGLAFAAVALLTGLARLI